MILEAASFKEAVRQGNLNPFAQEAVIICSYQFARSQDVYLQKVNWDLAIIDEAHRLRNVYKPTNKIANAIKDALAHAPKVLLTATPLQNSLLELYGLVSIVDEHVFGDRKSFSSQYARLNGEDDFAELNARLRPVCQRTLRRQVLEYIQYTSRIAVTQEFYPTDAEQRLYDLVSEYLQRDRLFALPSSQRQLMTLILRKLLASSSFAIAGTLEALASKLEESIRKHEPNPLAPDDVASDYESADELQDEWEWEDGVSEGSNTYGAEEVALIRQEVASLREFESLARSILRNSKGEVLLSALANGFKKARELGGPEKAIIFTESRRTQDYLFELLSKTQYAARLVLFNGTNTDPRSKEIYKRWLAGNEGTDKATGSPSADMRAALVDYFRDEAVIMIATEAAAEGINLQFCSLVVNYDLPWNPQRIEQRIGRCHRYGQKYDVVVVNFLNKNNAADQRVYELLAQKFRLFDGVFGASDEVLGSIESGVDFEKRIAQIYQTCRTPEQIELNFAQLQKDLELEIGDKLEQTRQKLLEHFDEEVQEKLRLNLKTSKEVLGRYDHWLWEITRFALFDYARFESDRHAFVLTRNPFPDERIHPGPYRSGRDVEDANIYRVGHPLAQRIIEKCKQLPTPESELAFDYTGSNRKISVLEPHVGKAGWLSATLVTVSAFEAEDHIVLAGVFDDGTPLDSAQCSRLLSLPAQQALLLSADIERQKALLAERTREDIQAITAKLEEKNARLFEEEVDKLDAWGEDQRKSLKAALKELEDQIKETKRNARLAPNLPEKLRLEREKRDLDAKRDEVWRAYETAAREIEARKDALMDATEKRLTQQVTEERLFVTRWRLN